MFISSLLALRKYLEENNQFSTIFTKADITVFLASVRGVLIWMIYFLKTDEKRSGREKTLLSLRRGFKNYHWGSWGGSN
ncbi:hypothetical protein E4T56_gene2574 [Termitomyces sp. T112]|nr:hypothetical protein E4T56_gene2574 [Termitomyces sp. T112]